MKRVVATLAHRIPERPPLQLVEGEAVRVGERNTEWLAFVFVTTTHGEGWVPARYVSQTDGRLATMLRGYDTTELSTEPGEMLDVVEEDLESGWLWCRSQTRREGWVPVTSCIRTGDG